jgi:uncharacterized membrane protein
MRKFLFTFLVIIAMVFGIDNPAHAQSESPVVRAVLFYSPRCGHCYYVITEVLPPIFNQYGHQLQMIGVDVTQPEGQAIFLAALEMYGIAWENTGIPFLTIGGTYLIGDVDIPQHFPSLIEHHLSRGGVDWPGIPGLSEMIVSMEATQQAQATRTAEPPTSIPTTTHQSTPPLTPVLTPTSPDNSIILTGTEKSTVWDRLTQDPAGNGLAIFVLVGVLIATIWSVRYFMQPISLKTYGTGFLLVPILCLAGIGIAGYLSYIEISQMKAVCGPVGDCNAVQQSEYARLFGILPIGVLGMAGYIAIIIAWLAVRSGKEGKSNYGPVALLTMTAFGTVFSIYLTLLEPFVLGATCIWCLGSAVIITILMLVSLRPAKVAIARWPRRTGKISSRLKS